MAAVIDQRAVNLRDLNQRFALPDFESRPAWEARARELRTHILAVNGLLPVPESPPLKAQMFETTEYRDYAVSKVFFQSHPGLLVTGNLFVPRGKEGPFPAVLNPHGHWPEGRFGNDASGTVLGRGISFARQGYVAFCYDMVGYNDSYQLTHRQESDRQRLWGFSQMSLQLYNSLRAVDFLQSLEEVDPDRIGCTGESGGGTQTFLLMSIDSRVRVAAPVVMVSARMQGGCVCENAPSLRLDTTNPEIAALMAPRPLLLVSATGDWTVEVPTYEYPFIRSIYHLYGAADRVASVQFEADHNYNLDSRTAVYRFFAKWLLGAEDPDSVVEQPFRLAGKKTYLVFANRPHPVWAPEGEKLLDKLTRERRKRIASLYPTAKREWEQFRDQFGPALAHLLAVESPREVQARKLGSRAAAGVTSDDLVLTRPAVGDRIPARLLRPEARGKAAALVVSAKRKDALFGSGGDADPLVTALLAAGQTVLLIDPWGVGEAQVPALRDDLIRERDIHHYLTYNRSDDANRIQDIVTALGWLREQRGVAAVNLVGLDRAGGWALLARTQAPFAARTVVDLNGFSNRDQAFLNNALVPALRSIGDLTTAAALIAPGDLLIHSAGAALDGEAVGAAYRAAGRARAVRIEKGRLDTEDIGRYLCR